MIPNKHNEFTARALLFAVGAALEADLDVVAQLEAEARAESEIDAEVYPAFRTFALRVREVERQKDQLATGNSQPATNQEAKDGQRPDDAARRG